MLRALALYQSARGRDWIALALLVPAVPYVWIALKSDRDVATVAMEFTIFSRILLLIYGGLTILREHR